MKINHNLIRSVFTIGAVAGVAVTAYFAAKNGDNICDACNAVKNEMELYPDKPSKIKAAVKMAPAFIKVAWKPLVAGGLTYGCMFASHRVTAKQVAALTATCAYVTRNRNFLEGKLKEYVGEEELAKIKKEFVAQEIVREKIVWGGPTVEKSIYCAEDNDDGVLCYEDYLARWFRIPEPRIKEAQDLLIKLFKDDSQVYCSYNDYYAFLGITMDRAGELFGWHKDDFNELHFTNTVVTPKEWGDIGPDGGELTENVHILNVDTWPGVRKQL